MQYFFYRGNPPSEKIAALPGGCSGGRGGNEQDSFEKLHFYFSYSSPHPLPPVPSSYIYFSRLMTPLKIIVTKWGIISAVTRFKVGLQLKHVSVYIDTESLF